MKKFIFCAVLFVLLIGASLALGEEPAQALSPAWPAPSKIDPGDTAWILVSAALVMLMTPGLALFYGGMVRTKNVLGTLMQSFIIIGVVTVQWVLLGYSLAFGPDQGGIIGSLAWFGLSGVGLDPHPEYGATIPHQAFMIYQAMFAVITPALITGAFAERMKFATFLVFTVLWTTLVYDPTAHWVWGIGGWIRQMGALDFAGGTVVHVSSGMSALAAALLVERRRGFRTEPMAPHNLPMTITGAAILWFGWFGFNAGSAISSGKLSTNAFVVTHIAAAAASLSWVVAEWIYKGKPTTLGVASGAVAGLVAITPASGFVGPISALAIGLGAGILCYSGVMAKNRLGYDDSLDVVGVHGVGGTWGALATGVFASKLINDTGADGILYGGTHLLGVQIIAVGATMAYAFGLTFLLLKLLDWTMGLKVSGEEEESGLDLSQHNETGYNI